MAHISCDFHSNILGMGMSMSVVLPQKATNINKKLPVLYLLHGLSDDHTIWSRRTSIERYADEYGLAVVMPNAHRSFYTNMVSGQKYFSYITEEVPELAKQFFNISDKREENFVAGLSMGGYGAFKIAMTYPEKYAAGASLSGAMDICSRFKADFFSQDIFGAQEPLNDENSLFKLADSLVKYKGEKPVLYQCCGTEDFLYEENIKFRDYAKIIGIDVLYEEGAGTHEWGYWDTQIKRVLNWLPLKTM